MLEYLHNIIICILFISIKVYRDASTIELHENQAGCFPCNSVDKKKQTLLGEANNRRLSRLKQTNKRAEENFSFCFASRWRLNKTHFSGWARCYQPPHCEEEPPTQQILPRGDIVFVHV